MTREYQAREIGVPIGALASHFAFHLVQGLSILAVLYGDWGIGLVYAAGHLLGQRWFHLLPEQTSEARSLLITLTALGGIALLSGFASTKEHTAFLVFFAALIVSPCHVFLSATLGIYGGSKKFIQLHDMAGICGLILAPLVIGFYTPTIVILLFYSISFMLIGWQAIEMDQPITTYLQIEKVSSNNTDFRPHVTAIVLTVASAAYIPLLLAGIIRLLAEVGPIATLVWILFFLALSYFSSQITSTIWLTSVLLISGVTVASFFLYATGWMLVMILLATIQSAHIELQNSLWDRSRVSLTPAQKLGIEVAMVTVSIVCAILIYSSHAVM